MPEVVMPRLSDTMETGILGQWVKHEGDQVRKGDVLAVIETDKAAMDMEAYDEGMLTRILAEEGASVPIGAPIAIIGEPAAASATSPASGASEASAAPATSAAGDHEPTAAHRPAPAPIPGPRPAGRLPASPLARELAREHGVDLSTVSGSGPGGRIVRADIEQAARERESARNVPQPAVAPARPGVATPGTAQATTPAPADADEIPLTRVRRLTAQRLAASAREAPHFYLTVVADVGELLAFRARANARPGVTTKININDLLIRACATALAAYPAINVSWADSRVLRHRRVGIGLAVAIDDGLIVPVIRDADRKTLTEIAREARDLADRARARKLTPDELAGGTFTISNLGMYGIRQFTAVINPPQAAILAIGEAARQPVVDGDQVTIATTMTLTLSIDHRAVDGATGAKFLTGLRELIEEPLSIVL